jgi:hypothetical protein
LLKDSRHNRSERKSSRNISQRAQAVADWIRLIFMIFKEDSKYLQNRIRTMGVILRNKAGIWRDKDTAYA